MSQNVISIGSYASFIIDSKDITPLMQIIERMTPVDRRWLNSGAVWVKTHGREVEMRRDDNPVITEEECTALREAEAAEKAAKEAAGEDA